MVGTCQTCRYRSRYGQCGNVNSRKYLDRVTEDTSCERFDDSKPTGWFRDDPGGPKQ